MARFIIKFYSSDNVLRKEVSVIGRKLSNKEVVKMNGKYGAELNKDLYYVSKKNELSIRRIVRYKENGKLDFVSIGKIPNYNYYKIIEV